MDSSIPDLNSFVKSTGPYAIGPRLEETHVSSIAQCVGRHRRTNEFVTLKMLQLMETEEGGVLQQELQQAKSMLYNEHRLLSLLKGESGVIGLRDFFMEDTYEEEEDEEDSDDYNEEDFSSRVAKESHRTDSSSIVTGADHSGSTVSDVSKNSTITSAASYPPRSSGSPSVEDEDDEEDWPYSRRRKRRRRQRRPRFQRRSPRLTLVTDCYQAHDLDPSSYRYLVVQHYVILQRRLLEREALRIFRGVAAIVSRLHRLGVVHRDLKLGNVTFDRADGSVVVSNFCLGRHLIHEDELLSDQRGSPAYISPEVLSGDQYKGKPCDVWAMGVMLYTMLFGRFPFYDHDPRKLFRKIKEADFVVPVDDRVSDSSRDLLWKMLKLNPSDRATADEALDLVDSVIASRRRLTDSPSTLQIVPDVDDESDSGKSANQVVPSPKEATPKPRNLVRSADRVLPPVPVYQPDPCPRPPTATTAAFIPALSIPQLAISIELAPQRGRSTTMPCPQTEAGAAAALEARPVILTECTTAAISWINAQRESDNDPYGLATMMEENPVLDLSRSTTEN